MRTVLRNVSLVVASAAVVTVFVLLFTTTRTAGQVSNPSVPRTVDGKPDFSGIWQTNNTAYWDLLGHEARPMVAQPGVYPDVPVLAAPVVALGAVGWIPPSTGVVEGNEIPYQAWAAARKKQNFDNWLDRDPEIKCFLPGVPRAMYMPFPYQIVQGPTKIFMMFEYNNASRTIHLDKVASYPNVAYMGYSLGRWDGDALAVESTNFTDHTWFDRSGNFHSDAMKVIERFALRTPDIIMYEATIEDPRVFTRPWKISMPIYRRVDANARLMDFNCVEMAEETTLGYLRREPLVKRWEGRTMIVDITRKELPPEVTYEERWHTSGNPPDTR